jgi:UDP-N-acetylglucosamine acyltransferase
VTAPIFMQAETFIHPSSIVESGAELGQGVRIGPFTHIGPHAVIGDNVEIISHVAIMGATTVGAGTRIFPQAALGGLPQNAKHQGGRTTLVIGVNCIIREGVTMHIGTDTSRGQTLVGDNGNFLAYTHVAHDCIVGKNATFANGATLAGHCEIGDNVIIGGLTAIHQFARIGDNAFLSGCSAIPGDVIPFGIARGNLAKLRGLNIIGMRRSGLPRAEIHAARRAYRAVFDRTRPIAENLALAEIEFAAFPTALKIIDFLKSRDKRYFLTPAFDSDDGDEDADAVA